MKKFALLLSVLMIWLQIPVLAQEASDERIRYDDGPLFGDDKFLAQGNVWPDPANIEYSFRNFSGDLPQGELEIAIANAFSLWSLACPNLAFSKIGDNLVPHDDAAGTPPDAGDIRILFGGASHGDVDFGAGVLAHAFYPPPLPPLITAPGDTHFNDDLTWALNGNAGGGSPYDLQTVALHEFGHALGLGHEPTPPAGNDAVMNPFYGGPRGLSQDDINGIRVLYCPGTTGSSLPIDLIFLFDLTGSFADDLPNIQSSIGSIMTSVASSFPNAQFGLASFKDFPLGTFGDPTDYAYRLEVALTPNPTLVETAIGGFIASGGFDIPESQYEGLTQVVTGMGRDTNNDSDLNDPEDVPTSTMGIRAGSVPVIFLLTDADFHDPDSEAGYPCATCNAASRGDAIAALQAADAKVFVLIARDPPNLPDVQGGGKGSPRAIGLDSAAQELADMTGGGVFDVGISSATLPVAIAIAINQVQLELGSAPAEIPTLSDAGHVALGIFLLLAGLIGIMRQRMP